ncbi:uncharacterized protein LOC132061131 [Lycium ferocissimum]|uniref:uncharacterized protein LOC132061131 n=1 Tax=Lycium ferocissimum TaxID=112874 RepID=UPI00281584CD|nr:uncharacterized protein LOC132061131 [Lycium ferocissimum]
MVPQEVIQDQVQQLLRIRDHNGDLVYAARKRLEDTTNAIAEAVAIEDGIQYCKILDGIWEVPWRISLVVKRIQRLREGKQIGVAHVPCSFIIFRKFHQQTDIGLIWSLKAGSVLLQRIQEVLDRRCIARQGASILMDQYAHEEFSNLTVFVPIYELGLYGEGVQKIVEETNGTSSNKTKDNDNNNSAVEEKTDKSYCRRDRNGNEEHAVDDENQESHSSKKSHGDSESIRNKDKERDRDRDREKSSRHRSRDRESERDRKRSSKDRDHDCDREKRDKDKEKERDRDREKEKERDTNQKSGDRDRE